MARQQLFSAFVCWYRFENWENMQTFGALDTFVRADLLSRSVFVPKKSYRVPACTVTTMDLKMFIYLRMLSHERLCLACWAECLQEYLQKYLVWPNGKTCKEKHYVKSLWQLLQRHTLKSKAWLFTIGLCVEGLPLWSTITWRHGQWSSVTRGDGSGSSWKRSIPWRPIVAFKLWLGWCVWFDTYWSRSGGKTAGGMVVKERHMSVWGTTQPYS